MAWNRIRPIALALIFRGDEVLVARHETSDAVFYRPLGGGIDVGEYAQEAVVREIQEELGLEIEPVQRRAVLENVFTYQGEQGHEVVFVIESTFTDAAAYDRDRFVACEEEDGEAGTAFPATWMPIRRFTSGEVTLYPTGVVDVLREQDSALEDGDGTSRRKKAGSDDRP